MIRSRDLATAAGVRQRRRSRAGGVALGAAVLVMTACGQQTPDATAGGTTAPQDDAVEQPRVSRLLAGDEKPRLTCPTGERTMMIADFAHDAKGAATPEKALARQDLEAGERLVISPSGAKAWVLRADGTANEAIGLLELRGWVVSERESCA